MKNVRESQLKRCIFLTLEEFDEIIKEIFGPQATTLYQYEGIFIDSGNDDVECDDDDILVRLSEYFDVNVTSFHSDNCEYVGVWVCYKDSVTKNENVVDAIFLTHCDNGVDITAPCKVNLATREVFDVQDYVITSTVGSIMEAVVIDGKTYSAYNAQEVESEDLADGEYWYKN